MEQTKSIWSIQSLGTYQISRRDSPACILPHDCHHLIDLCVDHTSYLGPRPAGGLWEGGHLAACHYGRLIQTASKVHFQQNGFITILTTIPCSRGTSLDCHGHSLSLQTLLWRLEFRNCSFNLLPHSCAYS